jgi:ribonuclease E
MTFTEAAVEVLRRTGKPLHFKEIAEAALRENLLSHVGQDPEITMGQRLAAMAKREDDRKVVAILPEGTFALVEWAVPAEVQVEAVAPPMEPAGAGEPLYRPREREPRPIHAQARRRLMELQAEHEEGFEEAEAERRRQDLGRKGQRRFPPPAEVVFEALAQRQSGAPLTELANDLLRKQLLSEALVRDPASLVAALLEDNRRRTEVGRKPAFIVDGDRVTLVEFPPASAPPEETRAPQLGARPMGAAQLGAEVRRAVVRALRRRLAELDTASFESLCTALLDKMGMRDVRVAKRSKEGPLYLARHRRGVSDLRVAVKLVRGSREIGRADVQELRRDLAHYSAQMGLVLAPGEAGRDARGEASAAGQAPVALFVGEALPEEMIACRVGATVQAVEVPDVDEAFFAGLRHREERAERGRPEPEARGAERRREREERPHEEPAEAPEAAAAASEPPAVAPEPHPAAEAMAQPEPAALASEAPAPAAESEEPREARRRRGRDDRPRATNAAEQAWGQPAGTMKFAPPPGPTVVAQPTSREEQAPAASTSGSGETTDDAVPPEEGKPEGF